MNKNVARAAMLIRAPVEEAFHAFVDPAVLTRYWLASSSGPLTSGATVEWEFRVPGVKETVKVTKFDAPVRLAFDWSDGISVDFRFATHDQHHAVVAVEAAGFTDSEAAIGATEGFAIVLCDLKTLLEAGRSADLVRDKAKLIAVEQSQASPGVEEATSRPAIEDRAAQFYVGKRAVMPMSSLGPAVPAMIGEVRALLKAHGLTAAGQPFLRYHVIDMPDRMDVELGIPVEQTSDAAGELASHTLPSGRYAVLRYRNVCEGVPANKRLIDWIGAQHEKMATHESPQGQVFQARLEAFLTNPEQEPNESRWEIELAILLERKS